MPSPDDWMRPCREADALRRYTDNHDSADAVQFADASGPLRRYIENRRRFQHITSLNGLYQPRITEWATNPTPPDVGQGAPDGVGVVIEQASRYSGWSESVMRAAIQATAEAYQAQLESLRGQAQHTTSNLQHLRDRHQQAQAVINARRHRNTGPQNPAGIDGRPRRHQHPTKAAADNARPATHTEATPVIVAWQDGTVAVGFDGAWR